MVIAEAASAAVSGLLTHRLTTAAVQHFTRSGSGAVPGSADSRWLRLNHAGDPVTLAEGPAVLAGLTAGGILRLVTVADQRRATTAALVAGLGSGLVGAYDDLYGSVQAKGFAGHLRALARGELTSGTIKIAGVGASALAAALIVAGGRPATPSVSPSGPPGILLRSLDLLLDTGLVAGLANLVNLCDLRPGRAGKAAVLLCLLGANAGSAPVLGAALGALRQDLAGRSMLGDTGANALGAGAGVAVLGRRRRVRMLVLGAVAALTLASERVSFTAVIEKTPWLRALDRAGRPG